MVNNIDEVLEFFKKNSILGVTIKGDSIDISFDKKKFNLFNEIGAVPQQIEKPIEEPQVDMLKSIESIRSMMGSDVQHEDTDSEADETPEGYYSLSQVENLTGLDRNHIHSYMRYYRVKSYKPYSTKAYYSKADVDKWIAERQSISTRVNMLNLAKELGITRLALNSYCNYHKINRVRIGKHSYLSKEDEAKIRNSYSQVSLEGYISSGEIEKLLGLSKPAVSRFIRSNNISRTVIAVNRHLTTMYDRSEVMTAIEQRTQETILGRYEITRDQIANLLNIRADYTGRLQRQCGCVPTRHISYNKTGVTQIYDIREVIECFTDNKYAPVLKQELERREAL